MDLELDLDLKLNLELSLQLEFFSVQTYHLSAAAAAAADADADAVLFHRSVLKVCILLIALSHRRNLLLVVLYGHSSSWLNLWKTDSVG